MAGALLGTQRGIIRGDGFHARPGTAKRNCRGTWRKSRLEAEVSAQHRRSRGTSLRILSQVEPQRLVAQPYRSVSPSVSSAATRTNGDAGKFREHLDRARDRYNGVPPYPEYGNTSTQRSPGSARSLGYLRRAAFQLPRVLIVGELSASVVVA